MGTSVNRPERRIDLGRRSRQSRGGDRGPLTTRFLMRAADTEPTEIHLGLLSLLWGLWMMSPFWSVFSTFTAAYASFDAFMPEMAWGALFSLVGGGKLIGVAFRIGWLRELSSILGASAWAFASASFIGSDWRFIATVTHGVPVLANAWVYLRLRQEIRCRS